ncbi:MAG: hypothetical protein M1830_007469, partial [Pleopsidium flavum]
MWLLDNEAEQAYQLAIRTTTPSQIAYPSSSLLRAGKLQATSFAKHRKASNFSQKGRTLLLGSMDQFGKSSRGDDI